jgi:hypothetical protein
LKNADYTIAIFLRVCLSITGLFDRKTELVLGWQANSKVITRFSSELILSSSLLTLF